MGQIKTNMLIDFSYTGTNRRGQKVKGEINSRSLPLAKAQLQKQGITVRSIRKKAKPFLIPGMQPQIKAMDIAIFVRQLATMMKASVPLIQGFDIVADTLDNPTMKKLVLEIKSDVESGITLTNALRKHPRHFDSLFCSLVAAGEQSGSLETMLDRVATYKEKSELLKTKIRKAVKYPIAVILVAMAVTVILLLKVVPLFADIFAASGAELPIFTQWVVGISEWIQTWWFLLIIIILFNAMIVSQLKKRSKTFQNFLDKLSLKLPVFGKITYQAIIARFARTLSTTFAAGVPMLDALDSTAGATNNIIFYNATQQVKDDVSAGQQLHFALRNTNLFPSMLIQMVSIGEEAGGLEDMLDKVATYYENEVDNAVDGLTSLMEPIIMVFLGVVIGGLVIAMYLPIFMMGSVI